MCGIFRLPTWWAISRTSKEEVFSYLGWRKEVDDGSLKMSLNICQP